MEPWTRSEIISAGTGVVAVLGIVFVIMQIRIATDQLAQAQLHQRTQLLAELHDRGVNSVEFSKFFQKIEYAELVFDEHFERSDDQRTLVRFLSFFELIARLENMGLLEFSDVKELFGYYMVQTHKSQVFDGYMKMLEKRVTDMTLPNDITFPQFRKLVQQIVESHQAVNAGT